MPDNRIDMTSAAVKNLLKEQLDVMEQEFDSNFYLERYPDVRESGIDPLEHYAFAGWLLGRDPCNSFSTSYYLFAYKDVESERMNPFYHYLKFGRSEGRWPMLPAAGSIEHDRLVAILSEFFDEEFYLQQYPDIAEAMLDPLEHYINAGFREGKIPFSGFDPAAYLAEHGLQKDDNPLYHYVMFGRFLSGRKATAGIPAQAKVDEQPHATGEERIISEIAAEFDDEYYLNVNQDVAASGMDPVRHYVIHGWKEGRNPHREFDTRYYLDINPDVKEAGVNPFWHYVTRGREENRKGYPAGGYKWVTLRALDAIDERIKSASLQAPDDIKSLEQILKGLVDAMIDGSRAFVASVSHDDYTRETGGVQLCIAEEQQLLSDSKINYLNIFPASPLPFLSRDSLDSLAVSLILNGRHLGLVYFDDLLTVLERLAMVNNWDTYLVIHALHGHAVEGVIELNRTLHPKACYYWLHDYLSICPGYHLLRNNVDYCHAPDGNSPACGICFYGEERARHNIDHERLFREIELNVISPSRFALDLWKEKKALPHVNAIIIAHRELSAAECRESGMTDDPDRPLKVAYLGYPITHKGWPVFENLAVKYADDNRYDFYHIGIGHQFNKDITFVEARSTSENLELMADIVKEHQIDIVILPSVWPETFSLTAYEGISAGCFVLASMYSGNIAALVQERGCGMIYENEHVLHAWFESGAVVDKARNYQSETACFKLVRSGITAPLILEASGIK